MMVMSDKTRATRLNTLIESDEPPTAISAALFYRGQEYRLGEDDLPFQIGRDDRQCRLVIASALASRNHCAIVVKEGQLGLLDTSTNGTAVKFGRADSVIVKQRFIPLAGQGCIKLGEKIDLSDPNLIMFKIVRSGND